MKKLWRLLLNTCLKIGYPQPFYTYTRLQAELYSNIHVKQRGCIRKFSVSSKPNTDNEVKQLLVEYPEPKKILWRVINEAYLQQNSVDVKPRITVRQFDCNDKKFPNSWQVTISMAWPEKFKVEATANKKSEAENICILHTCQRLKQYGILDNNNNPILPKNIITFGENSIKNAKGSLVNIYQRIWARTGKKEFIPKFNTIEIQGIFGKANYWKSQLSVLFPEAENFEGCSSRLRDAEGIAAAKALQWLKEKGVITNKRRVLNYTQEEESRLLQYHNMPYSVSIPLSLQGKMQDVLQRFENTNLQGILENIRSSETDLPPDEKIIHDIMTEEVYRELSEEELMSRSREMFEYNVSLSENMNPHLKDIRSTRSELPIMQKKEGILRLLEENQVVVLSGDTGCGKTTQVPQFILDDYISKMQGAKCNIVVTQPRRISAISIAERVASERNEKVGNTIGHQVRLNKILPQNKGAILYCSTGMLLRKLCSNPDLKGISHVIIDEIHERNIQIDFLLILLKKLIETNRNVKILMMSATFNTNIFSQYFGNCPVIHVPGKMHPVTEYFLEDLRDDIPLKSIGQEPVLNPDLVAFVINRIHETQRPGAILCFLPGWHDILSVKSKLLGVCEDPSRLMVCCAHSRLPHKEQAKIFAHPLVGNRKVILATNIAETSITVNDVVYVVNSGLHKGTSFDGEKGVASLGTHWITKANVRQRRGRAGRVQPGVCYNLFTRKVLMEMAEYPLPELLRMPLESVILDCKLYCPETKAEEFLSAALQPPSQSSLHSGVCELQTAGIIDEEENLTDLGKIIVHFGTHPRLSVALVYAAFLGCLDPVLTICAISAIGKEPFFNTIEEKSVIKNVKQAHDNSLLSDHLALHKIFSTWQKLENESNLKEYIEQNMLDEQSLNFIRDLKSLFATDLFNAGLIENSMLFNNSDDACNFNCNHSSSIFASLSAAFFPNVIKVIQGEISHGRLNRDAIIYSLLKSNRGYIQKESVASNEEELPSPWLLYFSALQSEARRLMMTSAVSAVPGICLLLFSGKHISMSQEDCIDKDYTPFLIIDGHKRLTFSCTKAEAELLLQWRHLLRDIFTIYISSLKVKTDDCEQVLTLFRSEFLPVLREVLEVPNIPFVKGQVFRFINNNLESEEL